MAQMYAEGFDTVVVVRGLSRQDGRRVPHPATSQGVATVVTKLLNIAQADRAYFGLKDYQQLQVVSRLARDLDIATEIVPCETVREPDGLALSSRNVRLSPDQRRAARVLSQALDNAQEIADTGIHDAYRIRAFMAQTVEVEPLAAPRLRRHRRSRHSSGSRHHRRPSKPYRLDRRHLWTNQIDRQPPHRACGGA